MKFIILITHMENGVVRQTRTKGNRLGNPFATKKAAKRFIDSKTTTSKGELSDEFKSGNYFSYCRIQRRDIELHGVYDLYRILGVLSQSDYMGMSKLDR